MVSLITIVFNLFLARILFSLCCCDEFSFAARQFLSAWEFFFCRETFSFSTRIFLFVWDFFFLRETFSIVVRLFISPWVFFFPLQSVSDENYSTQSKNFWSTIQERFSWLCRLHLVLRARHFYSLEKEEGERARRLW